MHHWLDGWTRLPEEVRHAELAMRLMTLLYPRGFDLSQLRYETGWAEADLRLRALAENELEASFEELGGTEFLDTVRAQHEKYGAVLGLTPSNAPIPEALGAFLESLRRYTEAVTEQAPREDADRLLAPLLTQDGSHECERGGDVHRG